MAGDVIVAWLHFVSIFAAVGILLGELALYRPEMSFDAQRLLRRIDAGYGAAAGAILVTGLLRVFWFGKGAEYYAHNVFFWVLIGGFALVGVLSLPPTFHFMRWRRATQAMTIDAADYHRIHRYLLIEAALFALLPLFPVMMARGLG